MKRFERSTVRQRSNTNSFYIYYISQVENMSVELLLHTHSVFFINVGMKSIRPTLQSSIRTMWDTT